MCACNAVVHHYEESQGIVVHYDDELEEKICQIETILRAKYGDMENMPWHGQASGAGSGGYGRIIRWISVILRKKIMKKTSSMRIVLYRRSYGK